MSKRDRMNQKRRQRLITKAQKARILGRIYEVMQAPSWNKRFQAVSRLRAELKAV